MRCFNSTHIISVPSKRECFFDRYWIQSVGTHLNSTYSNRFYIVCVIHLAQSLAVTQESARPYKHIECACANSLDLYLTFWINQLYNRSSTCGYHNTVSVVPRIWSVVWCGYDVQRDDHHRTSYILEYFDLWCCGLLTWLNYLDQNDQMGVFTDGTQNTPHLLPWYLKMFNAHKTTSGITNIWLIADMKWSACMDIWMVFVGWLEVSCVDGIANLSQT